MCSYPLSLSLVSPDDRCHGKYIRVAHKGHTKLEWRYSLSHHCGCPAAPSFFHQLACIQRKWKTITAYEDSSTDEEGPGGSSIYWKLPLNYRSDYKLIVRAMRRARHRRAYLTHMQRRGVLTVDVHPSLVKHLKGVCIPSRS